MGYLWKYMSFDKFESIINNNAIYVPSLKRLQKAMDPIEGKTLNCFITKYEKEMEKYSCLNLSKNIFDLGKKGTEEIINLSLEHTFVYSLNFDNDESYALWNIYSTNLNNKLDKENSVAIRIKESLFKKLFLNKNLKIKTSKQKYDLDYDKIELKNIVYKSNNDILKIINNGDKLSHEEFLKVYNDAFITKNTYYKFAREKRLVIHASYWSNLKKDNGDNIWLEFNIKKFFDTRYCQIIISPFAHNNLKLKIIDLLKDNCIENAEQLVIDSNIAIPD